MRITLLALCVLWLHNVKACDVCGCTSGGMGFGYIPLQNTHLIGLSYEHSHFNTVHPALFANEEDQTGEDRFNTANLWLRYHIKPRWIGMVIVPVKVNSSLIGEDFTRLAGLGDIQLKALYSLVKKGDMQSVNQANWYVGGTLTLPSGRIDQSTLTSLPNLQPGRGVPGGEFNTILSARRYNLGFNLESAFGFQKANSNGYRYGSEIRSYILAFARIKRKKMAYLPQLGISHVHRNKDVEDVSMGTTNHFSGITLYNAVAGFATYGDRFGGRGFFSYPLSHHISSGYVTPKPQINLQFLHVITFKKNKK